MPQSNQGTHAPNPSLLPTLSRHLRTLGWLVLACSLCACSGGRKPTAQRTKAKDVLVWIGTHPITRTEFSQAWKHRRPKHKTKAQVLRQLIDQTILWLEARKVGLKRSRSVRDLKRKAMVEALLQRDFEQWFRPETIDLLLVRKYYNMHYYHYNQPEHVDASHLLVMFPPIMRNQHKYAKLSAQERKKQAQIRQDAQKLAQRAALVFRARNPQTSEDFGAIARHLVGEFNKVDPELVALLKPLDPYIQQQRFPNAQVLPLVTHLAAILKARPYCGLCHQTYFHLKAWPLRLQQKRPLTAKEVKLLTKHLQTLRRAEPKLSYERLKKFSLYDIPGQQGMVERFLVAVRALKNGQFNEEPAETKFGFHIIFREKTYPATSTPFSKASKQIRQMLYNRQRTSRFRYWLEQKKKRYSISQYPHRLKQIRRRL